MTATADLKVTSHVGRDILAAAAVFKNEATAVWEYVVNSLQYVDRGISPKIQVIVDTRNRTIEIADNGHGMTRLDLQHFFTMHGENPDRRAGRLGRGKFGTGKSAAFGIANALRVDTVRNGLRNVAVLTREMIERSSGEDIPVQLPVLDAPTERPNGTIIVIEDIILKLFKAAPIIEYIERHLQAFRAFAPEVAVNSHVCEYREPELEREHRFTPTPSQQRVLGEIELIIKVARAPLPDGEQGVVITAGAGNLVAVERGGIQAKEFASYLFGETNVPALEASTSPIAPYDLSRSLQLNPQHPVAAVLLGFIGSKLEGVRSELVQRARDARKTEQARRLEAEAEKIASILNEDFGKIRERLHNIRSAAARPGAAGARFGDSAEGGGEPDVWVRGTQRPGNVAQSTTGRRTHKNHGRTTPDVTPRGEPDEHGNSAIDPAGGSGSNRSRPRGGFRVEYRNLGTGEDRSRYEPATLSILINLDHAVVKAALADGKVEDPTFRRLSYEIAFSEYAMALGYEEVMEDPNIPADDVLYQVRSSLNRIAAAAAALYR